MLVNYCFINAFWAILLTWLAIFMTGTPISLYAVRYGLDLDLRTRDVGFGYFGSTLTSLIHASFTFVFFALEAAIIVAQREESVAAARAMNSCAPAEHIDRASTGLLPALQARDSMPPTIPAARPRPDT
jgi:hypothetical protein